MAQETAPEIEAAITQFVATQLLAGDARGLSRTTELLDMGVLNSLNIMLLLAFLEERFGMKVQPEDVNPDNIQSIEQLTRWVSQSRT
ncbi:MAG: acyl carrier protein [Myxococcaceae bacterium]|nr:acyl carrier protein [Myxococcaceae bacterium]